MRTRTWMRNGVACAAAAFLVGSLLAADTKPLPPTVKGKLARKIPRVNVAGLGLMKALKHFGELSGLTIEADWTGLEIAGITKKTPVTVKEKDLPMAKVLDLTLGRIARKGHPLTWYVSGGKVHVTSQRRAILRQRFRIPARALGASPRPAPARRSSTGGGAREIDFNGIALSDAIQFLHDLSGQNFHVNWRALEATGITRDTPVTLKARGISVAKALDLVLDDVNGSRDRFSKAYWIVEGGIVKIATGEVFNRTTKVRTLDVSDLLMVVPNFRAPRMKLSSSGNGNSSGNDGGLFGDDDDDNDYGDDDDDDRGGNTKERREKVKQDLMDIIKMSIGEDMWAPTGKGSIRYIRNKLVISQTPLGFKLLEEAMAAR